MIAFDVLLSWMVSVIHIFIRLQRLSIFLTIDLSQTGVCPYNHACIYILSRKVVGFLNHLNLATKVLYYNIRLSRKSDAWNQRIGELPENYHGNVNYALCMLITEFLLGSVCFDYCTVGSCITGKCTCLKGLTATADNRKCIGKLFGGYCFSRSECNWGKRDAFTKNFRLHAIQGLTRYSTVIKYDCLVLSLVCTRPDAFMTI